MTDLRTRVLGLLRPHVAGVARSGLASDIVTAADITNADERERLTDELTAARAKIERLRAERDAARQKVHAAELLHCWTNEDGRRFVFADDLAEALGIPS